MLTLNAPRHPSTAEDLDDEGLDTAKQVVADVFDDPPVHSSYSEMARRIRIEMDKRMGTRGWSVVVGKSYGAYITQKIKAYAYLSVFPGALGVAHAPPTAPLLRRRRAAHQLTLSHSCLLLPLPSPPAGVNVLLWKA